MYALYNAKTWRTNFLCLGLVWNVSWAVYDMSSCPVHTCMFLPQPKKIKTRLVSSLTCWLACSLRLFLFFSSSSVTIKLEQQVEVCLGQPLWLDFRSAIAQSKIMCSRNLITVVICKIHLYFITKIEKNIESTNTTYCQPSGELASWSF